GPAVDGQAGLLVVAEEDRRAVVAAAPDLVLVAVGVGGEDAGLGVGAEVVLAVGGGVLVGGLAGVEDVAEDLDQGRLAGALAPDHGVQARGQVGAQAVVEAALDPDVGEAGPGRVGVGQEAEALDVAPAGAEALGEADAGVGDQEGLA